jgi:hypothetical protein
VKRDQRGFLLIYVVALVAAIAIILFQLNQLRGGVPQQVEKQLARGLEGDEARRLLDFVIAGTHEQNLPVDNRYLQFRRLLAADPARMSELGEAYAQLKSMLDEYGFKLRDPAEGGASGGATEMQQVIAHDGKGLLFQPQAGVSKIRVGDREYAVRIRHGNALPNLNTLPFESLARYLEFLGLPAAEARELGANLVDWRDADDFRTDQIGAEREYYEALERPYRPRNGPIQHWQELAYVKGVTPDRLQILREHLMLGSPGVVGALPNDLSADAIGALTGLRPDVTRALLLAYGHLLDEKAKQEDVAGVLLTPDAEAFEKIITWKPDERRLRIEIDGPGVGIGADYDLKEKRILGRW